MADMSTDQGTILPPMSWGVLWHPDQGWALLTPGEGNTPDPVPEEALALTAAFLRLEREPEFRDEMAEWFKAQKH